MNKILVFLFFAALLFLGFAKRGIILRQVENFYQSTILKHKMKLTSPAFDNNGSIPVKYTCDADGVNPPLAFSEIPGNAENLALIVEDPDAPIGVFVHWVLFHIPPTATAIDENSVLEDAVSGLNSAGTSGYTSPCPPSGTHRYIFTLFALDTVISGNETMTKQQLLDKMQNHILEQAQLIGAYTRQ